MKKLILCNTVYQTLVALWIVYMSEEDVIWDAIISDHMNDSEQIAERIKKSGLFEQVYHVNSLAITNNLVCKEGFSRVFDTVFPMHELKKYVNIKSVYSDIYFANFDSFSQILYNALSHRVSDIKLHLFEEGLASYSSFEKYYSELKLYYGGEKFGVKGFLHKYIYRTKVIPGNLTEFLAFNPQLVQWNPECKINSMKKIDCKDMRFRGIINKVFQYDPFMNEYDKKFIFFEESFFAEGSEVNDVQLIEALALKVGKENIMIKIHPRNSVNRFEKLGYKTNHNTSIPWEVIVMNSDDLSDKILITVASSCIINPIIVFGKKIQAYSLFDCIDHIPPILQNGYWNLVEKVYMNYPKLIHRCKSIEEIGDLADGDLPMDNYAN